MRMALVGVSVALCCLSAHGAVKSAVGVSVPMIDGPLKLDGRIDEPFWSNAPTCGDFHAVGKNGEACGDTFFKVVRDDTWLYFGFQCANPYLSKVRPKSSTPGSPSVQDDSVEIFIDPGQSGQNQSGAVIHFILTYNNIRGGDVRTGVGRKYPLGMPWLSAASENQDGWSAEAAIPLVMLAEHGNMTGARLNVARNTRAIEWDNLLGIVGEKIANSAWGPGATYTDHSSFAPLTGLTKDNLKTPLAAVITAVEVGPYGCGSDGKAFYNITAKLTGATSESGELELAAEDKPAAGPGTAVRKRFRQEGVAESEVSLQVPVNGFGERGVELSLRNPLDGFEIDRRIVSNPRRLSAAAVFLDRNYYTSEEEARVVAKINLPAAVMKDLTASVRSGDAVLASKAAGASMALPFPLASFSVGATPLVFEISRKGEGRPLFSQAVELVKRAPRPGLEWKIDKINRVVLNNGKPFLSRGMFMWGVGHSQDEMFKQIADNGFNTFIVWKNKLDPAEIGEYLKMAKRHNLSVIFKPDSTCSGYGDWRPLAKYIETMPLAEAERWKGKLTAIAQNPFKNFIITKARIKNLQEAEAVYDGYYQKNVERMIDGVRSAMGCDNLVAYYMPDEPAEFQLKSLADLHRRLIQTDGYHPAAMLYMCGEHNPSDIAKLDCYDIVGTDPYMITGSEFRGTPRYVGAETAKLVAETAARRAPVWITIANEFCNGYRPYTIQEMFNQTWLAYINGAAGVHFFKSVVVFDDTWDAHKRLNAWIEVVAPALTAPPVSHEIAYRDGRRRADDGAVTHTHGEFDHERQMFPDAQVVLRKFPGGTYLLMAANCFDRPTQAAFLVEGSAGLAEDVVTGKRFEIRDGVFEDNLAGYDIRAYKLSIAAPNNPIRVQVSTIVAAKDVRPDYVMPERLCLTNHKNVFPNPSFERAARAGQPDAYNGACRTSAEAFHGAHSCQLSTSPDNAQLVINTRPRVTTDTDYTLSFYAKADTPGIKVTLACPFFGGKLPEFELTKDWRRFTCPMNITPGVGKYHFALLLKVPKGISGNAWVDAIQLELGQEATDFEDNSAVWPPTNTR